MEPFDLDDDTLLAAHDPSEMFGALYGLPEQLEEAVRLMKHTGAIFDASLVQTIVITGLGGSAVGGDMLRTYAGDKCPVPILVNRSYTLPSYVGKDTLVIAVSYSGNTEETLSAYADAKARGAQIVAITAGGHLKKQAWRDGHPVITVPGGLQPRAAAGYLFIPQLILLQQAGLLPNATAEIEETLRLLREMRKLLAPQAQTEQNLAKQIARKLYGKIPLIHGAAGLTEAIAYRWKTQLNENAQTPAFAHCYPELNHNEIVGFDVPQELIEKLEIITLTCSRHHSRVQKRIEITGGEVLADAACGQTELKALGESDLAQMFSLLYVGDYASSYLAVLYGLDPTPVEKIELLKQRLTDVP
ncbi:bifunctional phosphoglucose/phosphomannose isomerase [Tumebacillus sp. BK434]|uniref:bifunctional phosphoglucose/phosphomannose isomerase n=1 Tax=Tumebacillus sp. BK434 TaxID=2512169 RepID=UPI0010E68F81|nr:bifunctional phosphoglucose/phosphomannose isomerase [Tumebacillus sp. BK434]TCP55577.1 bifunctional phosphoglucose/phosphomannose isomerase [Tumebacillus sp. BK434]